MTTKPIYWSPEKNRKLIEERDISFEMVVFSIQSGGLLDDMAHPNTESYAHQRIFVVTIEAYVYWSQFASSKLCTFSARL